MSHILIQNGTLIDGLGSTPIKNGAVLIRDNRIFAAGLLEAITLPFGHVHHIDAQGGTILPGFIDTHVHIMHQWQNMETMMQLPFSLHFFKAINYMRNTLNAGITTVRDAGGADLGLKQAVEQNVIAGPRLQISITALGITGGHIDYWLPSGSVQNPFPPYPGAPGGICDGVDEVRKKVREVLRAGADIIKICATGGVLSPTDHPEFTQFSPEELAVIVQEAHFRRGKKVMAHAQGAEGVKNAVRAGVHSIEHGIYLDDEAIDLMLEYGTYLVPTLLAPVAVLELGETTDAMPDYGVRKAREIVNIHQKSVTRAYEAGVKIAMGTDAGVMPHGTNLRELGLMAKMGMSPMEVIQATTKVAAECLGWDDQVGTLEAGKLADVVICRANPLDDLTALEKQSNIVTVIKDGQVVKDIRSATAETA